MLSPFGRNHKKGMNAQTSENLVIQTRQSKIYSCFFFLSFLLFAPPPGGSSSTEPVSSLSPTLALPLAESEAAASVKFCALFKVLLARLFLSVPNRSYERINHLCFLSSVSPSVCSRFPRCDLSFSGPSRHWKASSQQSAHVSEALREQQLHVCVSHFHKSRFCLEWLAWGLMISSASIPPTTSLADDLQGTHAADTPPRVDTLRP